MTLGHRIRPARSNGAGIPSHGDPIALELDAAIHLFDPKHRAARNGRMSWDLLGAVTVEAASAAFTPAKFCISRALIVRSTFLLHIEHHTNPVFKPGESRRST